MPSFSQLASREKLVEIVRWLCVLPTAVLGNYVVSFVVRAIVRAVSNGGLALLGESSVGYGIGLFLSYAPPQAAFVILGAKTAPRHRVAVSIVLAILGFCLSLMTHVLGQHLAGNRVGFINYMHLLAESAGLLSGLAYLAWARAQKRAATTGPL